MEFAVVGWPEDGAQLRLDHERFAYAGKFVMTNTGKGVARTTGDGNDDESDEILAAVAFNEDRTDPTTVWLRYVTVATDRRGEGIGPRLLRFVVERLADRAYERVKIAVNNPFAYQATYRAGFGYTGSKTGIAELVLEWPGDARSRNRYQDGLDAFRERELSPAEASFLDEHRDNDPPTVMDSPVGAG